jgi:hypothetical protein
MSLSITHSIQATSKDGKDAGIETVEPPPGAKVGERIYFEGYEGQFAPTVVFLLTKP